MAYQSIMQTYGGASSYASQRFRDADSAYARPAAAGRAQDNASGSATVTAGALNVRKGPGTGYPIIGCLERGAEVSCCDSSDGWLKISYGSGYGYVSEQYVRRQNSGSSHQPQEPAHAYQPAEPAVQSHGRTGRVVNVRSYLNVRSGPGTGHGILGRLSPDQSVSVIGQSDGWYNIEFNGKTGWVSEQFIAVTDNAPAPEQPQQPRQQTHTPEQSPSYTPPAPETEHHDPKPQSSVQNGKVVNVNSCLNVRTGPGTGFGIRAKLLPDQQVSVIGESDDWYKIELDGKTGWAAQRYIAITGSSYIPEQREPEPEQPRQQTHTPEQPGSANGRTVTTTASSLNVRTGPGTEHSAIGKLPVGSNPKVIGEKNGWYKIEYDDGSGWISKNYCIIIGENGSGGKRPDGGTVNYKQFDSRWGGKTLVHPR